MIIFFINTLFKPLACTLSLTCVSVSFPSAVLTATVSSIWVQGVVGGTPALGTSRSGQAEVGTVAVVVCALISAILTRRVEDQDVQHQLKLALRKQCVKAQ